MSEDIHYDLKDQDIRRDHGKRIAIILIDYNSWNLTEECMKSIFESDLVLEEGSSSSSSKDLETPAINSYFLTVILIDNGNGDTEKKANKQFPDVVTINPHRNTGFAEGNNLGIQYALNRGYDYIMLLNNDTVIESRTIIDLVKKADSGHISVPMICYFDKPNIVSYAGGRINFRTCNSENIGEGEKKDTFTQDAECTFANGCCFMATAETFKKIGLLNKDYFMYCEDLEWSLRAYLLGFKIRFVHDAVVYHKISASSGGEGSPFSNYYYTRNRFKLLTKYKDNFRSGAFQYAMVTRWIRMLQYRLKGNPSWKAIRDGIRDYKTVNGKSEKY